VSAIDSFWFGTAEKMKINAIFLSLEMTPVGYHLVNYP